VQTLNPENPAIKAACALDIDGFYRYELDERNAALWPPASRLVRLVVRSKDGPRARQAAAGLQAELSRTLPQGAELLGPAECPIGMIAGNHRLQLILRAPTLGGIHRAAGNALASWMKERDQRVYVEADVDPVSLL
jgi:primosomal protein N' (replication factor Y)